MKESLLYVALGTVLGAASRLSLMKANYRMYPTSPNGVLVQTTLAFIAAFMGAVVLPALAAKNWTAVTFLALAIQQLRQVRETEQKSLQALEATEFIPRGSAYIDAIAKGFESRNYIALIIGFITTGSATLFRQPALGLLAGALAGFSAAWILRKRSGHAALADVAIIERAPVDVRGAEIHVGGVYVANVGLRATRERISEQGYGIRLTPKTPEAGIALGHPGQRRAIASDLARVLGTERYIWTRRNFDTDQVVILVVPIQKDQVRILEVVREVPLLEAVRRPAYLPAAGSPEIQGQAGKKGESGR